MLIVNQESNCTTKGNSDTSGCYRRSPNTCRPLFNFMVNIVTNASRLMCGVQTICMVRQVLVSLVFWGGGGALEL